MTSPAKPRIAVLLVNLGTPDSPTSAALRSYLREFLSDPRVVELPRPLWWLILNLFIVPFRAPRSAKAYRAIWTERGSPLLALSRDLATAVQGQLEAETASGPAPQVSLAMRYGNPRLRTTLERLKASGIDTLLVLPLYPQYAAATSGSTFDAVVETVRAWRHVPHFSFISDYHRHPTYLDAVAGRIAGFWRENGDPQTLLFSFHGLPERCRSLGDPYYEQCLESAKQISERLGLATHRWSVAFQSRLGRAAWLQPYCVEVLAALPARGVRDVDVICPGFAVDCLETLEEIAISNREIFLKSGGARFRYIPALNAAPEHAALLADLIRSHLPPTLPC